VEYQKAEPGEVARVAALFDDPRWEALRQRAPSVVPSRSSARTKALLVLLCAGALGVLTFPYGWGCASLPPLVGLLMLFGLRGELAKETRDRAAKVELWPVLVLAARTELVAGDGEADRSLVLLCADGRHIARQASMAGGQGAEPGVLGAAYCRGEQVLEFVAMEKLDARITP